MSTEREMLNSKAHAPYGFVPLPERVFLPDWAPAVSQDVPFQDGLCGVLQLTLTAKTPIFVRGAHDQTAFFQGPKGPAIPGSGLRGAIRNVVEIASHGWMRRVNDHRYGVRDLQNQRLYVRHMAGIMPSVQGKNIPLPKVVAGWLQKPKVVGAVPQITPCHFAKVHYSLLMEPARRAQARDYEPGRRQSAVQKYKSWGLTKGVDAATSGALTVNATVEGLRQRRPEWLGLNFGRVSALGTGAQGRLVFTGQPSPWSPDRPGRPGGGNPKQHDFFFYEDPESKRLPKLTVTAEQLEAFEFIHCDGAQQHSLNKGRARNEEWQFWHSAFEDGERVPVFFLVEGGKLRAFGLAMMFRLAYKKSVADAIRNSQQGINSDSHADLAELIFGHVPLARKGKGKGKGAEQEWLLKGRVSFGLMEAQGAITPLPEVKAVLGAPKASYYPNYIEQRKDRPGAPPTGDKDSYATFMDDDVRLRGHKRYRVQPSVVASKLPDVGDKNRPNENVQSRFSPLPANTRFTGQLRVHNLRPAELGAVLWALDFGQAEGCLHMIGMARPLGYGACTIEISGGKLIPNDPAAAAPSREAQLQQAREAFAAVMDAHCGGPGRWSRSRGLLELQELARPLAPNSPHRAHMSIGVMGYDNRKINEFVEAKRAAMALPTALSDERYGRLGGAADIDVGSEPAARGGAWAGVAAGAVSVAGIGGAPFSGAVGLIAAGATALLSSLSTGAGWSPIKGGTAVEVELTGQNKKGKWVAKLTGKYAQGREVSATMVGEPPPGAVVGGVYPAVVTAGGDPRNLGIKWA